MTVSAASPTLTTSPNQNTFTLGTTPVTLKDTAVLQNGYHPTGAVIFTLFFNGGSTPVDTEMVTVNGNGAYTTPTGFTLPSSGTGGEGPTSGTPLTAATATTTTPATTTTTPDEQVTVQRRQSRRS